MTTDYDKLRELADAATPGPWRYDDGALFADDEDGDPTHLCDVPYDEDGEYIAAASPSAILSLLARLASAESYAARCTEQYRADREAAARKLAEVELERDARPEITPEDAASALAASGQFADPDNVMDEWAPVLAALRAHAAKAKVTT